MKIFIQIATYRDPELLKTISNLLANAKYPDNLNFGLVWQHDKKDGWDNIDPYMNDKRFRILDIPHEESGGMGWARSKTQSLYDGETYTMQIDSHMRFAKDWDKKLIDMIESLGKISNKPFITGYAFQYDPQNDQDLKPIPSTLRPIGFKQNGILFFKSFANKPNEYQRPYRARLVGGHFFITVGDHCKEYAYDPQLYYAGDELTLAVRSYTLGYDLYHPHENLLWHYYKRSSNNKHWTDLEKQKANEKEQLNIKRIQQMLGQYDYGIDLNRYGLGTNRSLQDYEKYAGIYFKEKRILKCAMEGVEPPVEFKNRYFFEQGFMKSFRVEVKDWQRPFLLGFKKNIDYLKIELMALDKSVIYSKTMPISFIDDNIEIILNVDGEKKPVYFKLEAFANGIETPKVRVEKDLETDLNWFLD